MRHQLHAILLPLLVLASVHAEGPTPTERPISDAESLFAIHTHQIGPAKSDQLIFALWEDGHVVWSEDQIRGGPPYRTARIEPQKFHAFLAAAVSDGLFDNKSLSRARFGPDSMYTVIEIKNKDQRLLMQSWHELYEANGKVVATDGGLTPLAGRSLFEVLAKEPPDQLFYRFIWSNLRQRAAALLPIESEPVTGKLQNRKGKIVWSESVSHSKKR